MNVFQAAKKAKELYLMLNSSALGTRLDGEKAVILIAEITEYVTTEAMVKHDKVSPQEERYMKEQVKRMTKKKETDIFSKGKFYWECPDCAYYTEVEPTPEHDTTEHDCK